jgi:hypothetical protein
LGNRVQSVVKDLILTVQDIKICAFECNAIGTLYHFAIH